MHDKGKTALMCGTANCIRSHLWGVVSHSSSDMIQVRTNKLHLIQLALV